MARGARFQISLDLLAGILGLPEGAVVKRVIGDITQQYFRGTVTVMVEHPDLPELVEGTVPVEVEPVFEGGKLKDWGLGGGNNRGNGVHD